ncbi:CBO0543 family protein [Effusibacillus consociatus]|uniref:CBO0543 family protein n=1 Tax=Effusibacillus consociatus TaxID=1117041 RepID=A0ABV9Q4M3_9BACL
MKNVFFIILFLLSWLWFFLQADKTRLRELFGVAVYSSFLGLITDLIMVKYALWSYKGLPQPVFSIPLLLDFGVYPVVAYLFVQNLPGTWGRILLRTLIWSVFAISLEWIVFKTNHMQYHAWWSTKLSFLADILIYLSIAGVYRFYRPAYVNSSQEPPSPVNR